MTFTFVKDIHHLPILTKYKIVLIGEEIGYKEK